MIHIFQIFHTTHHLHTSFTEYSYPPHGVLIPSSWSKGSLKDDQRTTKRTPVKSRRQVDTEFIWGLVDNNQLVVTKVILDLFCKTDGATVADSGHIDTTILELVDESLIVIGSHT